MSDPDRNRQSEAAGPLRRGTQPSLLLRDGRPTLEEGLIFARHLDVAAEGFFRFMLGSDAAEILARTYIEADNDYSYENALFAERDGVIVGMASGFPSERRRLFSNQPLKNAADRSAMRMAMVTFLLAPLMHMLETLADGDYYLLALAVDEEKRGEGIGSVLIEAMEGRARANGSGRLALDVAAKNDGARRLYTRHGMSVVSAWPNIPLVPRLFLRMAKGL